MDAGEFLNALSQGTIYISNWVELKVRHKYQGVEERRTEGVPPARGKVWTTGRTGIRDHGKIELLKTTMKQNNPRRARQQNWGSRCGGIPSCARVERMLDVVQNSAGGVEKGAEVKQGVAEELHRMGQEFLGCC